MRVAVFGLGYVGTVCGACLAHNGHTVIGVDVHSSKVELINQGQAPVIEPGLQEMLSSVVNNGKLQATTEASIAMHDAEVILVCVGTPPRSDGSLELKFLENVLRQIGENLAVATSFPVIVIRSTVPPGSLAMCEDLMLKTSGAVAGHDYGIVANPEFLREGSALADFASPAYTLIGTNDSRAAGVMEKLYSFLDAPVIKTSPGPAEIIKYVNNSFHALKIAFANEVGVLCKSFGIDSHQVMDLVCSDTKLNISPAYLKPGFAYGGSCLPKDLEALNELARQADIQAPLLGSIAESNSGHLNHSVQMVTSAGKKRLGFLGLSFKSQTDDLRESPSVKVIEALLALDYDIRIYDPNVNMARLIGSNRAYVETHIQRLADLLVSTVEELITFSETIIVTNDEPSYSDILSRVNGQHTIVDMTRLPGSPSTSEGQYHGICW